MAIEDQDEQIPFFSPATAPTPDPVAENDEDDYRTLTHILQILDREIEGLGKDFNSLKADDIQALQAQVLGRQQAYDILVPIQEMIKSAISSVDEMRKG